MPGDRVHDRDRPVEHRGRVDENGQGHDEDRPTRRAARRRRDLACDQRGQSRAGDDLGRGSAPWCRRRSPDRRRGRARTAAGRRRIGRRARRRASRRRSSSPAPRARGRGRAMRGGVVRPRPVARRMRPFAAQRATRPGIVGAASTSIVGAGSRESGSLHRESSYSAGSSSRSSAGSSSTPARASK